MKFILKFYNKFLKSSTFSTLYNATLIITKFILSSVGWVFSYLLASIFMANLFSIAGIPPFVGLVIKIYIFFTPTEIKYKVVVFYD